MAYEKTVWVNGQAPALDAEHLNKIEQGIADAVSVTPQTLSDDQKSQARGNIGAAPAGFGVGEIVPDSAFIGTLAELDATEKSGLYYYYNPNEAIGSFPHGQYGMVLVLSTAAVKRQYFFPRTTDSRWWVRQKTDYAATWGEWEFGEVPMEFGVEYRTTERYLDKPVYAKLVDCGTIPAQGTHKDLVFSPDASGIVSVIAYSSQRGTTLPFYDTNGVKYSIAGSGTTVMIWNYSESSLDTNVRALVKYTKITD